MADTNLKTLHIPVTGLKEHEDTLTGLAVHNEEYDLTVRELVSLGRAGAKVFENRYIAEEVSLRDEQEHILVLADQMILGKVRPASIGQIRDLTGKDLIRNLALQIEGGAYRILMPDEKQEDELVSEEGTAGYYAYLIVSYEEKNEPVKEEGQDTSSSLSYISTTYATQQRQTDEKSRGFGALLFAAMMTALYLGFYGPYIYLQRTGIIGPVKFLGGVVEERLILLHLGLAAGGLLMILLSMRLRSFLWPVFACCLFLGASYFLPGYTLFLALPVLFCVIAAGRRRSHGFAAFCKVLFILLILAGTGYFMRQTVMDSISYQRLVIRPTGKEEIEDFSGEDTDFDEDADFDGDFEEFGDFNNMFGNTDIFDGDAFEEFDDEDFDDED